ncbi:MAG: hypothetical protein ABI629_08835 [bacterium]
MWELKHDGYRALFYLDSATRRAEFISRTGKVMGRFQWLADALAKELSHSRLVLDGEIVVLDAAGHSHFNALAKRDAPATFYCFDIPISGNDNRQHPLSSRKNLMTAMWSNGRPHMTIGEYVDGMSGTHCSSRSARAIARGSSARRCSRPTAW